jgi:hypothetical protein
MTALARFRNDLAASLSQSQGLVENPTELRRLAELWAQFLKTRAAALEVWSVFYTALIAALGATAALAAALSAPTLVVSIFSVVTLLLFFFKARVDSILLWFKFVSGQVEAIAKVGPNPPRKFGHHLSVACRARRAP